MLILLALGCTLPGDEKADTACPIVDEDGDGFEGPSGCTPTDCDDADPTRHRGVAETCDGVDQDCDGKIDEDAIDLGTWFLDGDGDGFGGEAVSGCRQPAGTVAVGGDCDDEDGDIFPGAIETCDGVDGDCDWGVDEDAVDVGTWYVDADGDGYGATAVSACTQPAGTVAMAGDCDDAWGDVSPAGVETCDGVDEDCDGAIDDDPVDLGTWFVDGDGDGFGATTVQACEQPAGTVELDGDCVDSDPEVYPGAEERCDLLDRDCDGDPVGGAVDPSAWFVDGDADGYGDALVVSCDAPDSWAAVDGDCDDTDAGVYPGAPEHCDAIDEDCDGAVDEEAVDPGTWYTDTDGDLYGTTPVSACTQPTGTVTVGGDCRDDDATIHPGSEERCDGVDQDCDGAADEEAVDAPTWWADADGDGFGDPLVTAESCAMPSGYVGNDGDCDDAEARYTTVCPADCSTVVTLPGDLELSGAGAEAGMTEFCGSYNAVEGDLRLTSLAGADVRELRCLCAVGGDLTIEDNPTLSSLDGLVSLESIGGDLDLKDNTALRDLVGLASLGSIGGTIDIHDVNKLRDYTGLNALRQVGSLRAPANFLDYRGLETLESIDGDLYVSWGIKSLDGLESLREVGGDLTIYASNLRTLEPLGALESVGGLDLSYLDQLDSLGGLSSLRQTGRVDLWSLPAIADLVGLEGLSGYVPEVVLAGCSRLTDLGALRGVERVEHLQIFGDKALEDLAGLEGIVGVEGDLEIMDHERLADLSALGGLTSIGGTLRITGNLVLESLTGLEGLRAAESIDIEDTPITSLAPLAGLTSLPGDLTVLADTTLPTATGLDGIEWVGGSVEVQTQSGDYTGLGALVSVGGTLTLSESAAGLDSLFNVGGSLKVNGADTTGLGKLARAGALRADGAADLTGLTSLSVVDGTVGLEDEAMVAGLDALVYAGNVKVWRCSSGVTAIGAMPAIEEIGLSLYVHDCDDVVELRGWNRLRYVGYELEVSELPALVALPDWGGIDHVWYLSILGDDALVDISGLSGLTGIAWNLDIESNDSLTDLGPLYGIQRVARDFTFEDNDALSQADAEALRDAIGVENIGGTITIDE